MSDERSPSEPGEDSGSGSGEPTPEGLDGSGADTRSGSEIAARTSDPAEIGHPHLPGASADDSDLGPESAKSPSGGDARGGPDPGSADAVATENEARPFSTRSDDGGGAPWVESTSPATPEPANLAVPETTSSPWPIIGWLLFLVSVAVVGVAAFAGLLMPAIVLDIVSFWPAWVFALLIALALWPLRRRGIARIAAVLPLLLFTWLAAAVGLHLMEWELLPSASADVDGPSAEGVTSAELAIELDGTLRLRAGSSRLYSVSLVRTGGDVGPPDALERVLPSSAAVELQERVAAGWFRSSGWNALINRGPAWDLAVVASEVDISTRGIDLRTLSVRGDGTVTVGPVAVETDVLLDGDVTLVVPAGAAIEVIGTARVPAGWSESENGMSSGGSGARMTVVVAEGAIAEVVEG